MSGRVQQEKRNLGRQYKRIYCKESEYTIVGWLAMCDLLGADAKRTTEVWAL